MLRDIKDVADELGIDSEQLILYGDKKAKVHLDACESSSRPPGRLILVSAITPTDAGEGKTTTSIGLAQGLAKIGENVCLALREPSLGPTFGMKGGATGGGASKVLPEVDINLHFNGDFHAISAAHNLLAAMLDNHIHHGNKLAIDTRRTLWGRVVDLNDRALRQVVIGLGGALHGVPRETSFDITPASEVMAALCMADGVDDLRARLGRMIVALNQSQEPITAEELSAAGAMMVLLKDAMHPNLVQTTEGVPAFIHGGPFANIAHGCNSVAATKMSMAHADWTVTEAGFGFDLGAEKFFDIKCVSASLDTAAVVLVATVRALKRHGGTAKDGFEVPDPENVSRGLCNLEKHVESVGHFGGTPVVALNRFPTDSEQEIEVVRTACARLSIPFAVSTVFADGGDGGRELAEQVVSYAKQGGKCIKPIYDWSDSIKTKMEKIAVPMYGAAGVDWSTGAERDLKVIEKLDYGSLPLSVAKTHKSLSDDPKQIGRPRDFRVKVRNVILAAGAGFIVPLLGPILRMPGLPRSPQAEQMELRDGEVLGMI